MRHSLFLLVVLGTLACRGRTVTPVMSDGILAPCPASPNCVSTEAIDSLHRMPPIAFADSPAGAQARVVAGLRAEPRMTVVRESPGYVHAEARSRIFRFVDDVDVVIDTSARVIRFRSASRVGRNDYGVNRERMERLSWAFAQLDSIKP